MIFDLPNSNLQKKTENDLSLIVAEIASENEQSYLPQVANEAQ